MNTSEDMRRMALEQLNERVADLAGVRDRRDVWECRAERLYGAASMAFWCGLITSDEFTVYSAKASTR